MSARPCSPPPSVSLVEIKAETRLVLGAFLRRAAALPLAERPGRIGGMYRDQNKFRAEGGKDGRRRAESDLDSVDSGSSSEGEKKHRFKDLIKKHLKSRSSKSRPRRDQQKTDGRPQEEVVSPYSSPSDNGSDAEEEKKKKKKKKLKSPFSSIVRKIKSKKEPSSNNATRPTSLVTTDMAPEQPLSSPSHPPEFYIEVAETMEKFAKKHSLERQTHLPDSPAKDKEVLLQQLVQALQTQGDAINVKIQSSPFLRSSLANMSYPSFANLVDMFTKQTRPPAPAPASPTLSRIAMTMEVSRRVVTATGAQRIQGYAERYMEKFNPWVKSHGGWENILQLEDVLEYD